jgi:hypothetical protein
VNVPLKDLDAWMDCMSTQMLNIIIEAAFSKEVGAYIGLMFKEK